MTPHELVCYSNAVFLASVPALVLYQILTGRISTAGMLSERAPDGRMTYSPARLQLLMVTLYGLLQYLTALAKSPAELPSPDHTLLAGLGGSQAFYLASKAWAAYQATRSTPK